MNCSTRSLFLRRGATTRTNVGSAGLDDAEVVATGALDEVPRLAELKAEFEGLDD